MNSRPLTPPYIPFGIRRFNLLSTVTRTCWIYQNIRPVRVFHLLLNDSELLFLLFSNSQGEYCPTCRLGFPVSLISLGFSLSSPASSTVSRYTSGCGTEASHSNLSWFPSCWLCGNIPFTLCQQHYVIRIPDFLHSSPCEFLVKFV